MCGFPQGWYCGSRQSSGCQPEPLERFCDCLQSRHQASSSVIKIAKAAKRNESNSTMLHVYDPFKRQTITA